MFVDTLVDLIVARARTDATAPDPGNLRNGWRTDALFQDVDNYIVISRKLPAVYADVGRGVLEQVRDLPEMETLAMLAIFRGERLLPINAEREEHLVRMVEELVGAVDCLPEGTRKLRCQSLLDYHAGVFVEACGRFEVAAGLQCKSAQMAERLGDKAGVAIARFCEVWNLLKHALKGGGSDAEFQSQFSALEQAFGRMSQDLAGSALQVQWAEGNGPASMIEACVWLNKYPDSWSTWLKKTLTASGQLGEAFTPSAQLVRALDLVYLGDVRADEALGGIANSDDIPERRATALLVLARLALSAGKREEAENIVQSMPRQGAQHICVIARRMLGR